MVLIMNLGILFIVLALHTLMYIALTLENIVFLPSPSVEHDLFAVHTCEHGTFVANTWAVSRVIGEYRLIDTNVKIMDEAVGSTVAILSGDDDIFSLISKEYTESNFSGTAFVDRANGFFYYLIWALLLRYLRTLLRYLHTLFCYLCTLYDVPFILMPDSTVITGKLLMAVSAVEKLGMLLLPLVHFLMFFYPTMFLDVTALVTSNWLMFAFYH